MIEKSKALNQRAEFSNKITLRSVEQREFQWHAARHS